MAGGFIALHRQILNWEWYSDINTFRLFTHLLLKANFVEGCFQGVQILRGQLVTSVTRLASETCLTERQVRVSLKHLQMTGEVTSKSTNRYTVITIVKYDDYQFNDKQNDKPTTGEMSDGCQSNDKQVTREMSDGCQRYNNNNNPITQQGKKDDPLTPLYPPVAGGKVDLFDKFWAAYPRKVSKPQAKSAWKKLRVDEEMLEEILASLEKWKASYGWQKNNGQFIPYPATWLNNHQWEDDVQPAASMSVMPATPSPIPVKKVTAQNYEQRDYDDADEAVRDSLFDEIRRMQRG